MQKGLFALVLVLGACKPSTGSKGPEGGGEAAATSAADAELAAIADRIDPGPQPPLFEGMPAWARAKIEALIGEPPAGDALAVAAREAIAAWDKQTPGDAQALVLAAVQLGRGVVLAERAIAAGSADPELLAALGKAYRLIHQLELFQKNALFSSVFALAGELARKEGGLEARQVEEAFALLRDVVGRAPKLHLHVAARSLREHPRHPTIPDVLVRLAQAEMGAERHAPAVELRRLAVARKGARASATDHVWLADTCYRAFDLACGDLAKKTAEQLGPEDPGDAKKVEALAKQVAGLEVVAGQARQAMALAQQAGLDAQVERGHLLLKLGRKGEAEALFTRLRDEHPGDARPVTGLAVTLLHREGDFMRAAGLVRGARGLAGRDRLYYEVALGTVPLVVIGEALQEVAKTDGKQMPSGFDRLADELMSLIKEFAAFDPARAAVLELAIGSARDAAPKIMAEDRAAALALLRGAPARVFALTQKYPESRDAWKLLFTTSRLASDAGEAARMLTTPLPAALQEDPDVRLQQVRAQLDVALMHEHAPLLEAAGRNADSLPAGVDKDAAQWVRATIDALRANRGDKEALKRSFDAFAELVGRTSGADRARAINNAAIVQMMAGSAESIESFKAARELDEGVLAPALNLGALAFTAEQREGLAEHFKAVTGSSVSTIRVLAHGWLVALADAGLGDVAVTRKEFAEALKKEREGNFFGAFTSGLWGVASSGEFKVSFGYATESGLEIVDTVESRWWLAVPPPNLEALLAGDPRPKVVPKNRKAR